MPSDGIVRLLQEELHAACPDCRKYVLTLASHGPRKPSQAILARELGIDDRQAVWRQLGAHGLPAPRVLSDWVRFLYWLLEHEGQRAPLIRQAWSDGVDESVCYRTVRRVAGMSWRPAAALGSAHWIEKFRHEVIVGLRCPPPRGSAM